MQLGKLLVVGTARNCETSLKKNINRISRACKDFSEVSFYFVESDSSDKTKAVLVKMQNEVNNFDFISMGTLEVLIPDRVERIRFCRNKYIEFLKKKQNSAQSFDYVMVVDLDKVNSKLSRRAVTSCFSTDQKWDACFANQKFGYYDLYALRAPDWINYDIFKELRAAFSQIEKPEGKSFGLQSFFQRDRIRKNQIYKNMRKIPATHP